MYNIVFFCIPAQGHTNPTLGVVRELISMGHQVWYYSFDIMKEKIESTGAKYISCDKYCSECFVTATDGKRISKDLGFSSKVIVDTTLALDDMICQDMKKIKPDCIVADSMALWGRAAAMKLNIPFVSSTTTFAFNKYSSRIMKHSFKDTVNMLFSIPKVNMQIKRLRKNGYPIKNILDIIGNNNETDTIVYTSRMFQPCSNSFSDRYAFVGPSVRPPKKAIEKKREKLIYISMGTVNNDMLLLYQNCLRAFKDTYFQVIMSVGDTTDIDKLGKIPENISVFNEVDQMAVLEKADVFISHCGMNSVNESLYFGVPLIMLPQTGEQFGVASRVNQLEAGIMLDNTRPGSIFNAVKKIFSQKKYKENAKKISEDFKKCPGALGAANKIIEVCKEKEQV